MSSARQTDGAYSIFCVPSLLSIRIFCVEEKKNTLFVYQVAERTSRVRIREETCAGRLRAGGYGLS